MIVMSPSNVLNHLQCPRKAWAMREKLIPWKDSPQKARGESIHALLEKALRTQTMPTITDSKVNALYITDVFNKLNLLIKEHKLTVLPEQELAVTKKFTPTTFFANDVFFRARADFILLSKSFAYIGDWKTGKIYSYSKDQMKLESILVSMIYDVKIIHWNLFYLDQGETISETIDFTHGYAPVHDLLMTMRELQQLSKSNGPWFAKKNPFCKWCDWYHKEKCKESFAW